MAVLAVVWSFWLGVIVFIIVVLTLVALAVGYVVRAESVRYPPGPLRQQIEALLKRR